MLAKGSGAAQAPLSLPHPSGDRRKSCLWASGSLLLCGFIQRGSERQAQHCEKFVGSTDVVIFLADSWLFFWQAVWFGWDFFVSAAFLAAGG